jgi:hypothetical protein
LVREKRENWKREDGKRENRKREDGKDTIPLTV